MKYIWSKYPAKVSPRGEIEPKYLSISEQDFKRITN